jgi:hypothetical protein
MAKINFIVGPIGGGSAEIRGVITRNSRNHVQIFEEPDIFEDSVLSAYVGYKQDLTEDLAFMLKNDVVLTFEIVLDLIGKVTSKHLTASELFLVGPGISIFIERLVQLYSTDNVYFSKRTNRDDEISVILNRMKHLGKSIPDNFENYIRNLNQQILTVTDTYVETLGLTWTTGNSYVISEGIDLQEPLPEPKANNSSNEIEDMLHKTAIFLKPTALAVYVPRAGFIDFN